MNSRILQIALRISLLKEEFSEQEIAEAVKLLQKHNSSLKLLEYLAVSHNEINSSPPKKQDRKIKSLDKKKSKLITELEQKETEKYDVLREFEDLALSGSLLPRMNDLKGLGERLDKTFVVSRSRRETIRKLIGLLSESSLEEIKIIIATIRANEAKEQESTYLELANFLIEGKENQ